MKIIIDASLFSHRAGPGRYLRGLLPELVRLGFKHGFTLAAAPNGGFFPAPNAKWMLTHRPQSRMSRFLWRELFLPILAQKEKADVVFSPVFFAPMFFIPPSKSVVTILDLIHEIYPKTLPRFRRLYFTRFVRRCARRAAHILTLSENSKRDIIKRLGISPDRITPTLLAAGSEYDRDLGLDRLPEVRSRYGLPERYILYVGTFEPRKNVKTLLEAYRLLTDRGRCEASLVLAGEYGWGRDDPKETARRLGLRKQVLFTGYIDSRDQPSLYAGADVLVFPSFYEGFGLPPLEAMACGTPVIASNTASLPEVVGEAGILIDPRNVGGFAAAIDRVLHEPDYQETLRAMSLARAQKFTWESAARSTLRAIETVGVEKAARKGLRI